MSSAVRQENRDSLYNCRVGMWRSLVAHLTGGQGVAGSNPVIPTNLNGPSLALKIGPFVFCAVFVTCFRTLTALEIEGSQHANARRVHRILDRRVCGAVGIGRQRRSAQHVATGTVAEVHAREWLLVVNQGMESRSRCARRRPTRAILLTSRLAFALPYGIGVSPSVAQSLTKCACSPRRAHTLTCQIMQRPCDVQTTPTAHGSTVNAFARPSNGNVAANSLHHGPSRAT